MSLFDTTILNNGIRVITKNNANTPRIAINVFMDSGIKNEEKAGIASLSGRLLLQGTETKSAETLAEMLDSNAIEIQVDSKQDYTKIKAQFLNEDFEKALDILSDIMMYSTFSDFEKEARKFRGELEVDLDSPRSKAMDNFVKNIYQNHPYGHTHTRIIEDLPEIDQKSVKNFYETSLSSEKMNIVVIGDINKNNTIKLLESRFGNIQRSEKKSHEISSSLPALNENKVVTIHKNDAAQAQIIQGWLTENIASEDFVKFSILNVILGSAGLSSRLFTELRDKKGLAYVVRSSYEPLKYSGVFSVYIATEPSNINIALEGFNEEIKKLQDTLVSDKELEDAISNFLGKRDFYHETNSQQAFYLGYYDIIGLGADYDDKLKDKIKHVTAHDIRETANKYFNQSSVTSILAPEQALIKI